MNGRAVFLGVALIAVTAAIGGGFWVAGSPASARMRRLDERRLEDLFAITNNVANFYEKHGRLPEMLREIQGHTNGDASLADPLTSLAYEYQVVTPTSYKLCATFQAASTDYSRTMHGPFWTHASGPTCYDLTLPVSKH